MLELALLDMMGRSFVRNLILKLLASCKLLGRATLPTTRSARAWTKHPPTKLYVQGLV